MEVALFFVIGDIQSDGFRFGVGAAANDLVDQFVDDDGCDDGPDEDDATGFELFDPEVSGGEVEEFGEAWVCVAVGKDSGENGAYGAADCMDAEGVERVVVPELGLQFSASEPGRDSSAETDEYGAVRGDESGCWGDGGEAGDGAGAEA